MSIEALIARWVTEERLCELKPDPELGDPIERTLVISREIKELIDGPWEDEGWARRCGRLRQDLEAFVTGQVLGVCMTPHEHKTAYMGRLGPIEDEVWDIRSRDPKPGVRVFGRFAKVDTFVALFWSPRSVEIPWSNRPPLGKSDTREWRDARNECKTEWRSLFHPYEPVHSKDDIHEYLSDKDKVYLV